MGGWSGRCRKISWVLVLLEWGFMFMIGVYGGWWDLIGLWWGLGFCEMLSNIWWDWWIGVNDVL